MRKSYVQTSSLSSSETEEAARLSALRSFSILDTLPEQGYDDVTQLASYICGTPISLISFVDGDRQWFKSAVGLATPETTRADSFCAHTIENGQTLVVEDAFSDRRFQGNNLVLGEPGIRFYAGAPIMDGGHVLGTICVIDTVPKTLTPHQISALEALARQVQILLEHRRDLAAARLEAQRLVEVKQTLKRNEEQMALAAEAAGIASWFFDPERNVVGGDTRMGHLFGVELAEGPAEVWLAAIHPEDRERVGKEFVAGVEGKPYDTEYRVLQGTSFRWVRARARLLKDDEQHRMVGICEDITNRKLTEEELHLTAERLRLAQSAGRVATWEWNLADGTLLWGEECRWIYGRPPDELRHVDDLLRFLEPDDAAEVMRRIQPALAGTGEYNAEFRVIWPDGSVHWTQAFGKPVLSPQGVPVRIVGFNIDVSERKIADQALIRTEKLAAVGRLASSIAHEINNPLEAVTNLLYLATNSSDLQEAKPFLETAEVELRRASAITSQTLRFHKQATRPTSVTFADLMAGIFTGQHSRLVNAHIRISERDRAPHPTLCFEGEIRQVLTNLIGNAIDAMHGRGGVLSVRGREGHDWQSGRTGVIITIADNGTGMSEITRAKLFDAFFTTKGIGGTGLGLWISKEILDRHHGRILFRSSQRAQCSGTVFTIFLPFDAVARSSIEQS